MHAATARTPMRDNTQTAYSLALAGGLVLLAGALLATAATLFFVGGAARWMPGFGMTGWEDMMMGFIALGALVNIACGVLLLVAAPRLRDADPTVRRQWATWAIVVGAASLVTGGMGLGLIGGGLGLAAGILTMMDQPRPV